MLDAQTLERQIARADTVAKVAGGVVHNFNNMLSVLLGRVELMLAQVEAGRLEPRQVKQALLAIQKATLDAAELLKRLRDLTRPPLAVPLAPIDLDQVVRDAVEFIQPHVAVLSQSRGVGIRLTHRASAQPALVNAQRSALVEVLVNLILNAIEAMPEGGTIELATTREGDQVALRVTDTGTGMPEEVRERAFTPFFTTKSGHNTGLGLSSARELMLQHDGSITLASALGQGTTVTLRLPLVREARPAGSPGRAARVRPGLAVLLVEDDVAVGDLFREFLRQQGCRVVLARTGRAAVEALDRDAFDVVVTDLLLPEVSGWQVARVAKARTPAPAVVVMTGTGPPEDRPPSVAVDAMLSKPIDLHRLLDVVAGLPGAVAPTTTRA